MNPFFFGSGIRRLFGVYSPALTTAGSRTDRAAVLCNPWGPEYQYAHRSLRYLANALTVAGIHVLRFDYFGTGDSAGEAHEASMPDWVNDIEMAVEELQDSTGVASVDLVGLRLGATLAAQVALRRQQRIDRLVLWDPVLDGAAYLQELRAAPPPAAAAGNEQEIQGFTLTDTLTRQLLSLDMPSALEGFAGRSLMLISGTVGGQGWSSSRHHARLAGSGAVEEIESPLVWRPESVLGLGALPTTLVRRIVEWLGGQPAS